jgi:hypothetical protein
MSKGVVFLLENGSSHNLRTGLPHGRVRCHSTAALIIYLCTLLKEHLAEDIFFLGMRIVVLDIVVVRLIKHTRAIMITVGILISNSTHLVL